MSGGGGRKAAIPGGEEAEVEALLRAAQDAVLLNLQANSHLVSSTSAPAAPPSLDGAEEAAIPGGEEAEVEALLRAAQDAVLLKLQANSHLVSSASASAPAAPPPLDSAKEEAAAADPLGDDLARRFDELKSRAAAAPEPKPKPAGAAASGMDELEARFAALKGAAGPEKEARVRLEDLGGESEEDEADEVDKVMRWAVDAARLDVATSGAAGGVAAKCADDEEEEEKDEKSSEEDDDEEERLQMEMARKRKEMAKSKSKNRWFFL